MFYYRSYIFVYVLYKIISIPNVHRQKAVALKYFEKQIIYIWNSSINKKNTTNKRWWFLPYGWCDAQLRKVPFSWMVYWLNSMHESCIQMLNILIRKRTSISQLKADWAFFPFCYGWVRSLHLYSPLVLWLNAPLGCRHSLWNCQSALCFVLANAVINYK